MARVIVVGAGVVGLSCAVRLLEAGHRVDVLARDLPLETTSAVAAAIWYPYRALPQDRVTAWSGASYAEFVGLAGRAGHRGADARPAPRCIAERTPDPWWRAAVPSLDRETALPRGLRRRLDVRHAGGRDAGLPALAGRPGRGARRHPHPDEPLRAARGGAGGQLRRARRPADGRRPLGGAGARAGAVRSSRSAWTAGGSTAPGTDVRRAALARHRRRRHRRRGGLEPRPRPRRRRGRSWPGPPGWCPSSRARGCCGTRSGCGRCGPPSASSAEGSVVHCYGHGGAGVTLSWGMRRRGRRAGRFGMSAATELAGADHRGGVDRPVDVRERRVARPGPPARRGEQVGVDLEQHQRPSYVGVVRVRTSPTGPRGRRG